MKSKLFNLLPVIAIILTIIVGTAVMILHTGGTNDNIDARIQVALDKYVEGQTLKVGADTTFPAAGMTYALSGAGVSRTATTITLSSFTLPQTGRKILDADLSNTFYLTLEPGNTTRQEIVSCTTVVQNVSGSATLSGCARGLLPITPYTASSTYAFPHGGGSQAILSDPPQLFNQYLAKDNNGTTTGIIEGIAPTLPNQFATKAYVDGAAFGGIGNASETATGTVEIATAIEAASSTQNGTLGRLTIPASLATSTYNSATAALRVLMSDNSGFLDDDFLPALIAKNLTFSGSIAFSGALDVQATSTAMIGDFPAWQIGKQRQVFTNTGTTTFAVPSGITKVKVTTVGAGAGGGSCATGGSGAGDGGGGGGAGGIAIENVDVTGTTSIQVFVGTAGVGATSANGTNGTWSTFGTNGFYNSASGGSGGASEGDGGGGGVGSGGDMNFTGGGGGGGIDQSAGSGSAGIGGSNMFGGGAQSYTTSNGAASGGAFGGGGAGGNCANINQTIAGGNGGNGGVIIDW
jgi:hypothetical protein